MIVHWLTLGALIITLTALTLTIYYLRRAATFGRIKNKLISGDPLTAREQKMLDGIPW